MPFHYKWRKPFCEECRAKLDAVPPDNERKVWDRTDNDLDDVKQKEYSCTKCGHKNIIYWGYLKASIRTVRPAKNTKI